LSSSSTSPISVDFDNKPIQRGVREVHLAFSRFTVTLHPTDDVPEIVELERVDECTTRLHPV